MAISIDTTDVSSHRDIEGFTQIPPGRYHVLTTEATEDDGKLIVKMEILAGTNPGLEGRVHSEFFSLSEKAIPKLKRFLLAARVIAPNTQMDVSPEEIVNRELIIEMVEGKPYGEKKTVRTQIDWAGSWPLDDPDVRDVPRAARTRAPAPQQRAAADPYANL